MLAAITTKANCPLSIGDMNYDGIFTPDERRSSRGYDDSLLSLPEPATWASWRLPA